MSDLSFESLDRRVTRLEVKPDHVATNTVLA